MNTNGGNKMSSKNVVVVPAEKKGKFKVLVNFIQEGVDYDSKEHAEKEAEIIRNRGF
jgi:hypothetical protein